MTTDATTDGSPTAGAPRDPATDGGEPGRAPPRMVYDDECGFCTWAARRLADRGGVRLVGFGELTPDQRARLPGEFRHCAHLLTDDAVYSCGEAMTRALEATGGLPARLLPLARRVPGFAAARELCYRWIADHRGVVGRLLRATPARE
ncbi:MAG: DUF393 domain-containing protein [Halobacteriaceae archaeon]